VFGREEFAMHIHAAGHGQSHAVDHAKLAHKHEHKHEKHADKAERKDGDSFEKTKLPGVVRNLLAGHYKGVAALRLAINHHDKIEAALNGQAQPVVEEHLEELSGVVDEQIDSLLESASPRTEQTDAIQELREQFQKDLTELGERFADSPDRSAIEAAARELTDGLLSGIETILTPADETDTTETDPTEPPTDTTGTLPDLEGSDLESAPSPELNETPIEPDITDAPVTDGSTTEEPSTETPETPNETVDLTSLLNQFREAVDNVLGDLSDSLSSISLPAPPPYSGHGKAYAKFLAAYEQLYHPAAAEPVTDAPAEETTSIDVTA
jgi:hypothetical protein